MKDFDIIERKEERELVPVYSNQKSFYKKAKMVYYYNKYNLLIQVELYSYNTLVCTIKNSKYFLNEEVPSYLLFSSTTLKHLKEFLKQFYYSHRFIINTKKDIIEYNNKDYYKINKEVF